MILVGDHQERRISHRRAGDFSREVKHIALRQALVAGMIFVVGLAIGYYWAAANAAALVLRGGN